MDIVTQLEVASCLCCQNVNMLNCIITMTTEISEHALFCTYSDCWRNGFSRSLIRTKLPCHKYTFDTLKALHWGKKEKYRKCVWVRVLLSVWTWFKASFSFQRQVNVASSRAVHHRGHASHQPHLTLLELQKKNTNWFPAIQWAKWAKKKGIINSQRHLCPHIVFGHRERSEIKKNRTVALHHLAKWIDFYIPITWLHS